MDEKKNSKKKVIAISIVSVVALIAIIGVVVFVISNAQILKLYNATLELGQENYLEELTKEENIYIKEGYTYSVKDNKIDINNAGTYEVVFEIKGEGKTTEEIKKIQVVDTTPPTVELKKDTFYIGDNIKVEEIVTIKDLSATEEIPYNEAKVKIEGQFDTSKEGQSTIKISATDKNGVTGTQELTVNIKNPIVNLYEYLKSSLQSSQTLTLESGNDIKIKYHTNSNIYEETAYINFTTKECKAVTDYKGMYLEMILLEFIYFDENFNITQIKEADSLSGNLKNTEITDSDISLFSGKIKSIYNVLGDEKHIIQLTGKTIEQLKNETIDLRELQ